MISYLIASMAALCVASMLFLGGCQTVPNSSVVIFANGTADQAKALERVLKSLKKADEAILRADPGQSTDPSANQATTGTAGSGVVIIIDVGSKKIGIPVGVNASMPAGGL